MKLSPGGRGGRCMPLGAFCAEPPQTLLLAWPGIRQSILNVPRPLNCPALFLVTALARVLERALGPLEVWGCGIMSPGPLKASIRFFIMLVALILRPPRGGFARIAGPNDSKAAQWSTQKGSAVTRSKRVISKVAQAARADLGICSMSRGRGVCFRNPRLSGGIFELMSVESGTGGYDSSGRKSGSG